MSYDPAWGGEEEEFDRIRAELGKAIDEALAQHDHLRYYYLTTPTI